jgi:amino acid transporter
LSFLLAVGAGPGSATGFKYWKKPGAFAPYKGKGDAGKFYGFWASLVNAVFAYLGTELIGVTVGEAQNPRKTIPRAIKLTFYRILFFYCLAVFFLGMLVPYDSPQLAFANKKTAKASASPFVLAIRLAGIKTLPGLLNACILLFTFSASNSDLYIASRTLYGLAEQGHAPKIFRWTDKRGVPVPALALSAIMCCTAFMNVADDATTVFGYFVNLTTIFGLLSWISLLVSHIFFVRARRAQGITNDQMAYTAPLGLIGSYVALFFCILIALTKNFPVFTHDKKTYGNFDYKNFITGYLVSSPSSQMVLYTALTQFFRASPSTLSASLVTSSHKSRRWSSPTKPISTLAKTKSTAKKRLSWHIRQRRRRTATRAAGSTRLLSRGCYRTAAQLSFVTSLP